MLPHTFHVFEWEEWKFYLAKIFASYKTKRKTEEFKVLIINLYNQTIFYASIISI